MDNWEKFNETLLCKKEDVYSQLNMKGITDVYYTQTKRVSKKFQIKILENTMICMFKAIHLLLADAFKNYGLMYMKIYKD